MQNKNDSSLASAGSGEREPESVRQSGLSLMTIVRKALASLNPATSCRRYEVTLTDYYQGRFETFWTLRPAKHYYDSCVARRAEVFITLRDEWTEKTLFHFQRGDRFPENYGGDRFAHVERTQPTEGAKPTEAKP